MLQDRALGILQDIPELRDSPMLEIPFSDRFLDPMDRWMTVTKSDSLTVGGYVEFHKTLSEAAHHILSEAGRVIGVWNLFDGEDYREKRIPSSEVFVKTYNGNEKITMEFTCDVSKPFPSSPPSFETHPSMIARAMEITKSKAENPKRFSLFSHERSLFQFHDKLEEVAISVCRDPKIVVRDLFSDLWNERLYVVVIGEVKVGELTGAFIVHQGPFGSKVHTFEDVTIEDLDGVLHVEVPNQENR